VNTAPSSAELRPVHVSETSVQRALRQSSAYAIEYSPRSDIMQLLPPASLVSTLVLVAVQ
jgi:hypothetical protein